MDQEINTQTTINSSGYTKAEEWANFLTHLVAAILSSAGLVLIVSKAGADPWSHRVSAFIFGSMSVLMFTMSAIYHVSSSERFKPKLRALDHALAFGYLAAAYTPFLNTEPALTFRRPVLFTVWTIAIAAGVLKFFSAGRFKLLSTLALTLLGWALLPVLLYVIPPYPLEMLWWALAGGVLLTVGGVLYMMKSIPFVHAVWHVVAMAGCFCHWWAIYRFILNEQ